MDITLRQLGYFVALCETRHFGRAAARAHVSQPALSVQIRELEERIGAKLVDRSGRQFALTPTGQDVLQSARRLLAELADLEDRVRWRDGLSGRLRIGAIPTIAPYLLPEAVPILRAHDLSLDLKLREAQTAVLLDDLADGRLDAAILALPAGRPGLIAAPLFEDRFLLAGSAAQIAALKDGGRGLGPDDLDPDRLLLLDEGHCLADQALEACALDRGALRVDMGAASLATLSHLVAEGFGLTFLPESALATELAAAPGLTTMRFSGRQPARTMGLVRRDLEGPAGWFDELAQLLRQAGENLLARAARAE